MAQENGVLYSKSNNEIDVEVPTMLAFIRDLIQIMGAIGNSQVSSFCYHRLKFLEQKFQMHQMYAMHLTQLQLRF